MSDQQLTTINWNETVFFLFSWKTVTEARACGSHSEGISHWNVCEIRRKSFLCLYFYVAKKRAGILYSTTIYRQRFRRKKFIVDSKCDLCLSSGRRIVHIPLAEVSRWQDKREWKVVPWKIHILCSKLLVVLTYHWDTNRFRKWTRSSEVSQGKYTGDRPLILHNSLLYWMYTTVYLI